MDQKQFEDLLESVKEAGAYLRGEGSPGRVTFVQEPDPRAIRKKLNLSQTEFAKRLGIKVKTLRNWEQGRRSPDGPAQRLLEVAERHPEIFMENDIEEPAPTL